MSNVDVHSLLKKYILNLKMPREQKGHLAISSYNKSLFLSELEACTGSLDYPDGIKWSDEEFDVIIKEILSVWEKDISLLSEREKENPESSELFERLFDKLEFSIELYDK